MKFTEFLQRYHISPLRYEDGTVLEEKDYRDFFMLLVKYDAVTRGFPSVGDLLDETEKKVDFVRRNGLLPMEDAEILDMLMEQDSNPVLNRESNMKSGASDNENFG